MKPALWFVPWFYWEKIVLTLYSFHLLPLSQMYAHGHLEDQEIVGPHLHVSGCQGANSMCLSVGGLKETRFCTVAAAYEPNEWESLVSIRACLFAQWTWFTWHLQIQIVGNKVFQFRWFLIFQNFSNNLSNPEVPICKAIHVGLVEILEIIHKR